MARLPEPLQASLLAETPEAGLPPASSSSPIRAWSCCRSPQRSVRRLAAEFTFLIDGKPATEHRAAYSAILEILAP